MYDSIFIEAGLAFEVLQITEQQIMDARERPDTTAMSFVRDGDHYRLKDDNNTAEHDGCLYAMCSAMVYTKSGVACASFHDIHINKQSNPTFPMFFEINNSIVEEVSHEDVKRFYNI